MSLEEALTPSKPKERPKHWTPLELVAATLPEPDAFLGTLLARQTIMLIEGRRGSGKTHVIINLGGCLALGRGAPFGLPVSKPVRVLFLSQEMNEISIRKRIEKHFTIKELQAIADTMTIICRDPDVALSSDEGAAYIVALAEEHRADVVIIDALRDVKGKVKENDNDEMGIVMVRLRDNVAARTNAAIVLIHHFGKIKAGEQESGRGASVIEDVAADIIYIRDPKDGTGKRTGTFDKTRDGSHQDQEFAFEIYDDEETGKLQVSYTNSEEATEDSEIKLAVDAVRRAGGLGMRSTDIVAQLSWNARSATRRLTRACALGLLERFSAKQAGLSSSSREFGYRIPAPH